jgi:hypothetical protein
MKIQTSIVIFIYKRSKNLVNIIEGIRKAKPNEIYIVADGPKGLGEEKAVIETRELLESLINWPCEIKKNYSDRNLGLKERFRTGIDWVFSQEEKAIFIEDDCLPDPTFFKFCDDLLEKYKDDQRIFSISGNNFLFGQGKSRESYYFSKYPHIWGWAIWKRSWDQYDSEISDWQARRQTNWLREVTGSFIISKFWKYIFDRLSVGKINTWDYQWSYAHFSHNGLAIAPSCNLIQNIGFDAVATNTKTKSSVANLSTSKLTFPLTHPPIVGESLSVSKRIEHSFYANPIEILGLVRHYVFWIWSKYAHRN